MEVFVAILKRMVARIGASLPGGSKTANKEAGLICPECHRWTTALDMGKGKKVCDICGADITESC